MRKNKKTKGVFMSLHNKFIEKLLMDEAGLCVVVRKEVESSAAIDAFDMVHPEPIDVQKLVKDGHSALYWGRGMGYYEQNDWRIKETGAPFESGDYDEVYTPLRQNLMILAALINGEKV